MSETKPLTYKVLQVFNWILTSSYYKDVEVEGEYRVPKSGPVIIASNHPNALVDAAFVFAYSPRLIRIVAKDTLFKIPILAFLMRQARVVPIKRKQDHVGEGVDNTSTMQELVQVLLESGAVQLFPEGTSTLTPSINRIRTGAARLAFDAAVQSHWRLRPRIVPCGLNYSAPAEFRSKTLLRWGAALEIDDALKELYERDPMEAIRELTTRLEAGLKEVTVNADDWESLRTANTLRKVLQARGKPMTIYERFELSKRFLEVLAQNPDEAVREQADVYALWLDVCKVRDDMLRRDFHKGRVLWLLMGHTVALMLALPPALPLLLLTAPIWLLAVALSRLKMVDKDTVSTVRMSVAGILTAVLYLVLSMLIGRKHGLRAFVLAVLLLPFAGLASIRVFDRARVAIRTLPSLLRLIYLQPEMETMRHLRTRLADTAERLLQQRQAASSFVAQTAKDAAEATQKLMARL